MKSKFSFVGFLFLFAANLIAQDYRVLSSNSNSIVVEVKPKITSVNNVEINGKVFKEIFFAGGLYGELLPGEPAVQYLPFNFGVPAEFGNTVQILKSDFKIIKGALKPFPKLVKDKGIYVESSISDYLPNFPVHSSVEFGEFGLVRDLPVQTIKVFPVAFDRDREEIKVYTSIVFKLNFAATPQNSAGKNADWKEAKRLKDAVVNFDEAKLWIKANERKLNKVARGSLLATGVWYKFDLTEEGIYKISFSELANFGIDNSVDPRTIKFYNYGGYDLPHDINEPHFDDMHEIPIYINGEEDGKFDENDYILFYGRGVDFWEYDVNENEVLRNKHHYSKKNTYFVTSGGSNGKRLDVVSSSNQNSAFNQTTTKAYDFIEDDRINIIKSGLDYLGDEFNASNNSINYIKSLSNILSGSKVEYKIRFVNESDHSQLVSVFENNNQVYSSYILGGSGYSVASVRTFNFSYSGSLDNQRSLLKIRYNVDDAASKGFLDFIEYRYVKLMKAIDDELVFYSKDSTTAINYTLTNFSNSAIWCFNVTEFDNVKIMQPSSVSGGEFKFQAMEQKDNVQKYLAVNKSKFKSVPSPKKVENSNIHGIDPGAEYLIVTVREFKEQAQKLADYRANGSWEKLSVKIVFMDEIYNEFSSGVLDPTALRNFLKYAYFNWEPRPFYVVFFGDGDYDSYNVEGLNLNFIPTFQTKRSFDEVYSYPTDDYYGRVSGDDKRLDFAIGRLNVQSIGDAEVVVAKIIEYEMDSEKGLWRNRITLVADDGLTSTGNDGSIHTSQSETLANQHIPAYFDLNKLYLSAFPTVSTGFGRRKPQVNEEIINAVNNGTLLLNFIGHGNPEVWTHEVVFEKSVSIPQMKNDKYFFLTAATCDFGKYDDPAEQSGTEEMVLKHQAGAIGGISAVRPVYSNSNAALNYKFYDYLLGYRDSSFLPRTIGEAYFLLKQTRINTNDEKFHLFGDPGLRLDEPHYTVEIDSVNGVAGGLGVQLKALGEFKLNGSVVDLSGNVLPSVNGQAIISIFDSERKVYLEDIRFDAIMQGGVIFRGRSSVENGRFSTSFTVPKDISYENKKGKIIVYLQNDYQDGIGFNNAITVGGTDSSVVNDKKGPNIEIYYDDMNFENSYLVNPDFNLVVKLEDQTGLNTTGTGVGHKLEAILNDDVENPIDLTDYFIGDLDAGGKSGVVKYRFTELPEGDYKIKIKAWDVFNNFSQTEDYFSVVSAGGLVIRDVYNYPNPFSDNTSFTFQHNLTQAINVKIKIYTIAGRLIQEIEENNIPEKFVKIPWDGRDRDGNTLASGTYFYKLIVSSEDGSVKENFLGKLAVIR